MASRDDDPARQYRLPRKGERVRFWVVGDSGAREQVEATVLRRHKGDIEFRFDGDRPGFTRTTRAREVEILAKPARRSKKKPAKARRTLDERMTELMISYQWNVYQLDEGGWAAQKTGAGGPYMEKPTRAKLVRAMEEAEGLRERARPPARDTMRQGERSSLRQSIRRDK